MTRIRLVAFDLDGTLTRGNTVIECLATAMGFVDHARALEALHEAHRDRESLRFLREQIADRLRGFTDAELCGHLPRLTLAPGARDGLALLRRSGVETAIVTFTWEFAAAWLARELGADHWLGTRILPDGTLEHVWSEDKARWLGALMARRGIGPDETAAVGDSWRDAEMLRIVGRPFYVGAAPPPDLDVVHLPDGDLLELARLVIGADERDRPAPATETSNAAESA